MLFRSVRDVDNQGLSINSLGNRLLELPVGPRGAIMKEQGGWQGCQGTAWVDLWLDLKKSLPHTHLPSAAGFGEIQGHE